MDNLSNPLDLLSTKMCSPLVVYVVYVIVSGITLFMSRNILKRFQSQRMENLLQVHMWFEVKFLIVMGVVLYGLCQYNQVNLAWIFLLLPVIYVILKNLFIFCFVSLAHQNAPKEVEHVQQQNYGIAPQVQQAMMQAVQQPQQLPGMGPQVNKDIGGLGGGGLGGGMNAPLSSSISSLNGGGLNSGMAAF
tara:strand:- start:1369 stop:1938 length:570 start_codon:yes stop_codon:yes gene_type:complete